jgi:hypothetical protein
MRGRQRWCDTRGWDRRNRVRLCRHHGWHLPLGTVVHDRWSLSEPEDEAIAAARRFDVIAGLPGQLTGYLPEMRAANPRVRVYVYINGTYLHPQQFSDLPSWVMARTLSGDLIRSNPWGNYLGTPSEPRWFAYKHADGADALAARGADGCSAYWRIGKHPVTRPSTDFCIVHEAPPTTAASDNGASGSNPLARGSRDWATKIRLRELRSRHHRCQPTRPRITRDPIKNA